MSISIRPYKPSDAAVITLWLKSEYIMRQWCADRYEHYPVTPEDMNAYHARYIDGQRSRALTMTEGDDIVGYITHYALRQVIRRSKGWDSLLSMIQSVAEV